GGRARSRAAPRDGEPACADRREGDARRGLVGRRKRPGLRARLPSALDVGRCRARAPRFSPRRTTGMTVNTLRDASAMELWTFPPNDQRYWSPHRETMPPDERDAAIAVRLREVMRHAYATSPFYRKKWDEAGIDPESIRTLEDFERVPVVTKAELRASQAAQPPFGDYLCVPESEVHHIHGTSGTTGKPTAFAIGRDDWRTIGENHARILWGMGFRPGDTIFFGAIFSLYMGSWGAMLGAERMRARSFPFGAGAQGMTARAAQWLAMIKPAGFYGTPSYALRLAEVAREEGYDP